MHLWFMKLWFFTKKKKSKKAWLLLMLNNFHKQWPQVFSSWGLVQTPLRPWFHSSVHLFNNDSGKDVCSHFLSSSVPHAHLSPLVRLTGSCPQFFFSFLLWIITSVRDSWEAQAKIPLPVHNSHTLTHTNTHRKLLLHSKCLWWRPARERERE